MGKYFVMVSQKTKVSGRFWTLPVFSGKHNRRGSYLLQESMQNMFSKVSEVYFIPLKPSQFCFQNPGAVLALLTQGNASLQSMGHRMSCDNEILPEFAMMTHLRKLKEPAFLAGTRQCCRGKAQGEVAAPQNLLCHTHTLPDRSGRA